MTKNDECTLILDAASAWGQVSLIMQKKLMLVFCQEARFQQQIISITYGSNAVLLDAFTWSCCFFI